MKKWEEKASGGGIVRKKGDWGAKGEKKRRGKERDIWDDKQKWSRRK